MSLAEPRHKLRPKAWTVQAYRRIAKVKTRHIVVCGIPRSGTTLLYQMIRNCTDNTITWPNEMTALHPEVIETREKRKIVASKDPYDILVAKRIKKLYKNIEFIVLWRDPREVLASKLNGKFWVRAEDYIQWYNEIEKHRRKQGFTILKYRQLLEQPETIEEILRKLGANITHPFSEYHKYAPPEEFTQTTARPLDTSTLNKWKQNPEALERVQNAIKEHPILSKIAEEYEK